MDHKKRIIELEEQVYDARDYVATMQKDNQDAVVAFKTQREQNQRQLAKLSAALDQSTHRVEEQNAELITYGRAAEMLKTKHSLLDKRADHLEQMVKKAESLLITMDHSYNEILALSES
jgi:hypothetical protein